MAAAVAPRHRDDDLVLKLAFGSVFNLDEAATEAVSALYACKTGDAPPTGTDAASKQADASRGRVGSVYGVPDGMYPQYLVRRHLHCASSDALLTL
jgi:hypothetical protein